MERNLIKGIQIDDIEEAESILGFQNNIEKGRNVGDILFYNGKKYIWTEYAPGKFDWHIDKNKIIKGKGINGLHGINALKKVYSKINKDYSDVNKITLKRTPNDNWRLYYDNEDAGVTIDGNTLTEFELKADNVCYQDKRVVDNFELLKNYMEFNNPDDVYFVQIIKRWKDNKDKPDAEQWRSKGKLQGTYHSGGEFLNYWLIHSNTDLDNIRSQIIKICTYNNARAYISINSRSQNQVNAYIGKFKSRFLSNDPRYKNAEAILYGQAKTGPNWKNERFKVLLDIDTTRDSKAKMPNGKSVNIWDEVKHRLNTYNIKVAAEYETPSGGLHLILNNKNNRNLAPFYKGLKDFDDGKDLGRLAIVHPSEDIKMVLYSNVDTEGY